MTAGKRWTVYDRLGHEIYLTHERWAHITEPINHPEMAAFEEHLKVTLQSGKRQQNPLNPRKYHYLKAFDDLELDNTHIVAVVLFGFSTGADNAPMPNNYVVTAYQKEIG
jgi:hypothetical protein